MADSYYKTKVRLATKIYNNQKEHSKDRGYRPPEYTRKDKFWQTEN